MTNKELVLQNYTLEEVVRKYGQYEVRPIGGNLRSNSFIDSGFNKNRDNKVDYNFEKNVWYDMSSGIGGGIIEYVMYNLGLPDEEETIEFLIKEKGLVKPKPKLAPPINKFDEDILYYHDTLKKEEYKPVLDYLHEKGCYSDEYIDENLIGFQPYSSRTGRIIYPYFDVGEDMYFPVYYKARILPKEVNNKVYPDYKNYVEAPNKFIGVEKEKQEDRYKGMLNSNVPYNYWRVDREGNEIYIVEGNNDSDNLFMLGINNLCTSGKNGTTKENWNKYFIPILKNYKKIIILGDNDKDGREAVKNWIEEHLFENKIYNVYVEIIPREIELLKEEDTYNDYFIPNTLAEDLYGDYRIKDVNDVYRLDPKLIKKLRITRIPAIEYLAMYYTKDSANENVSNYYSNFSENVIGSVHRHMNPVTLRQQVEKLSGNIFSDKDIQLIKEDIRKSPLDKRIIDELISQNRLSKKDNSQTLIYNERVGFYKFNGKIWEHVDDSYICSQISELLGYRFTNGAKINSVLKALKSESRITVKNEEELMFNQKDIVVFNNGTLYLNNGTPDFQEGHFDPNDRVTFISDFDYKEQAENEDWIKFIKEVTETYDKDGNLNETESYKKSIMLQEFAGYILFGDCSLEKALVLFGKGENGKSVYFGTLEKLFDKRAVTQVKAPQFGKPHISISIKDSILNISGETKDSFFGAEEQLKTIISGESIQDSYKFRDDINFIPRAKLIISANNPFTVNDSSNGMARRFLFVFFKNEFTTDKNRINNKNIKQKDFGLKKRLTQNLSGIFNWCLDGYKMLKLKEHLNEPFTESEECLKQYENFKISNSPVRGFVIKLFFEDNTFIEPKEYQEVKVIKEIKENSKNKFINGINQNEDGSITVKLNCSRLFDNYKIYCDNDGYKPTGKKRFGEEIKRQVEDLNLGFNKVQSTTRKDRGTYYYITYNQEDYNRMLELNMLI